MLGILDPKLPGLTSVEDTATWWELLRTIGLVAADTSPRNVRVELLKHHPGSRCTFRAQWWGREATRSLIGKLYDVDRPEVYDAMRAVQAAGFDGASEFGIPRPLAYLPSLRLLLQEEVNGESVQDLCLRRGARIIDVAERCARWLLSFQASAPVSEPPPDRDTLLASLARWSARVARLGEPFGDKAACLWRALQEMASTLAPVPGCAGHGSYSPAHVVLVGRRTIVLDWDGYDVADPARDVSRFVVAVRRLALGRLGSVHSLDDVASEFLSTFLREGPSEAGANMRFYVAATWLRLAKYADAHRVSHWREKLSLMLDEGLRAAEGGD